MALRHTVFRGSLSWNWLINYWCSNRLKLITVDDWTYFPFDIHKNVITRPNKGVNCIWTNPIWLPDFRQACSLIGIPKHHKITHLELVCGDYLVILSFIFAREACKERRASSKVHLSLFPESATNC